MYIAVALLVSGVFDILAGGASLKEYTRVCPTTRVNLYTLDCAFHGVITDPDIISKKVQATVLDCAAACLSSPNCKTLRYVNGQSLCYLYGKSFKDMYTTYYNFEPGNLYDRLCFSQNCNVIAACNATNKCVSKYFTNNDQYWIYDRYACNYGATAKRLDHYTTETLYDGNLTACEAVDQCADDDVFDLHYHKPSHKWVCRGKSKQEIVSENQYSLRNHSVGAGYGYYLSKTGYID